MYGGRERTRFDDFRDDTDRAVYIGRDKRLKRSYKHESSLDDCLFVVTVHTFVR